MIAAALVLPVGGANEAGRSDPTGPLNVTDVYSVQGNETYLRVQVASTGYLIVGKGARLEAQKIQLKDGGFEVDGGTVVLGNASAGNDVNIKGKASTFILKNGAKLVLRGPNGESTLDLSKGGDAAIVVTVSERVYIDGATIECYSGTGYSNPNPWVDHEPLDGYFAAGGNATVSLGSSASTTTVKGLKLTLVGGNGGNAADAKHPNSAAGSKGGGYSNGGSVSGWVGSGGRTGVSFTGLETSVSGLTVTATSGKGGRAGNGGGLVSNSNYWGSGGGGGYSGGDGIQYQTSSGLTGDNGGKVTGYIGSGGQAQFEFSGYNLTVHKLDITATSGSGGDAGNGGHASYYDGGGGGGYGGGAGGGYYGPGGNGDVNGRIGAGGNVGMTFTGTNQLLASNLTFTGIGGMGGKGGNGGQGGQSYSYAGGGGGGYGGGGGTAYYAKAGDGKVAGEVGCGGNVSATFNGGRMELYNSTLVMFGGSAGKAGNGGDGGYYYGGGGGGGYGGGGGSMGYYGAQYTSGSGFVGNNTGRGGAAFVQMTSDSLPGQVLARANKFYCIGGNGGDGGPGGKPAMYGGGGGGGYGGGGGAYSYGTAGTCTVKGGTGDGGGVGLIVRHEAPSISKLNSFSLVGGAAGNGKTQVGGGSLGGAGAGAKTSPGAVISEIPMGVPVLASPANGEVINSISPTLEWEHILYSTTDGEVISYSVQVDNNDDFSSPEVDTGVEMDSTFTPTSELSMGGVYYWRVMATYLTGNTYGYGPSRMFSFNTQPVLYGNIPLQTFPEDNLNNKGNRLVNLSKYFKDDLFTDQLAYNIVYETDPSHILGTIDGNFLSFSTPTPDWYGQERFAVRASDPLGLWCNSNNFTVRVTPVNDAPRLTIPADIIVTEGMEHFFDLTPYVNDVDSKLEQMVVTTNSSYIKVDGLGLYLNYTPGITGEMVKITVNDTLDQTSVVLSVIVDPYIASPVIIKPSPWEIVMSEDTEYSEDLTSYAVDQKTSSSDIVWNVTAVSAGNPPIFNALILNKHTLKIIPGPNLWGTGTLVLVAINQGGKEDSRTVTVTIREVNDAPTVARIPDVRMMAGTTKVLDIAKYITDVDNTLADLKLSSSSPLVSVDGLKLTIYIKGDTVENQDIIPLSVSDGVDTSTGEFLLKILAPPSLPQLIPNIKTTADNVKSVDLKEFVQDRDTPEAALKWTVTGVTERYFSATVDPNSHILKITPKKAGRGEMTLTVTDPDGGTASQVVLVTVTAPPKVDTTPTGLYVILAFVVVAVILGVVMFALRPKKGA